MKKFIGSVISNLFTLLLSLTLAILIWVNAQRVEDPVRSEFMTIPITILGQPDDSILIDPSPDERLTVQIVFDGPTSVVTELTTDDFSATIDISNVPFGEEVTIPVDVQSNVPRVTLRSQILEENIFLEQLYTRDIPILLDTRGDVARGYTQGDPLIDPQVITISGPASDINELDVARVTVFLNNAAEDIIDSRQPIFYDIQEQVASVRGLSLSTEQVDITIPVIESADAAIKFIDADVIGEPAPGYQILSINVNPPSVLVQGRPTLLGQINRVQTEPVDITGLTEDYQQQVALTLPEGITQDEVGEVFVEINIEPFLTTSAYTPTITIQGLEDSLEATINPESVRVILFGPEPVLTTLLDEEVAVSVDLFSLVTGTYSLEPDVNFPDRGIELRSIEPSQITITISEKITLTDELTTTLLSTESSSLFSKNTVVNHFSTEDKQNPFDHFHFFGILPFYLPRRAYS